MPVSTPSSPAPHRAPRPATFASPPARQGRRVWIGAGLLLAGLLIVVVSGNVPWVEVYSNLGGEVSDVTYSVWDLHVSPLFPFFVWWPLPIIAWAAVRALGGWPRIRRGALLGVLALGVLSTFGFSLIAVLSVFHFPFGGQLISTTAPGSGLWICLVGYAVLALGTLLLGRVHRVPTGRASVTTRSTGETSIAEMDAPTILSGTSIAQMDAPTIPSPPRSPSMFVSTVSSPSRDVTGGAEGGQHVDRG